MRVLIVLALFGGVPFAGAAELIPYQLPAQVRQSAPPPPVATTPAVTAATSARIPDSVYRQFEARVRALKKPEERASLANNLTKLRVDAASTGDVGRELHYTRLLEAVRKVQGESR
jgi:hypothetical protein